MTNQQFPASDAVGPPPYRGIPSSEVTDEPDALAQAKALHGITEPDTPHPVIPWLTRPRRVWLYGVIGAAEPALIAVGAANGSTAALVGAVALSIVGTGVALPNTVAPRD